MDIHNGISNPNFTYTGGQAIVPDENGILRRTPAGYPAVEGGRWVSTLAEGALLGPELNTNLGFDTNISGWDTGLDTTAIFDGGESLITFAGTLEATASNWFKLSGSYPNVPFRILLEFDATYVSGTGSLQAGCEYTIGQTITPASNGGVKTRYTVEVASSHPTAYGATFGSTAAATVWKLDNISVREVIPQWYPPTSGTTRSISTRNGLRTIQTADTSKLMLVEPAMTNKCACRKSNPTDTTGVTGAGGATVTRVLDTDALTAGGYQDICTTFYDYELSIPQNGTISMAGAVANLNKHSLSLDMRLVSGIGVQLGLTGQTSDVTLTAAFSRQKKENLTPLAITDVITITNLNADTAVVRCILPGLEESTFCTSRIAPAADTAAAQTRQASVVSASTSGVFPMVSASAAQNFAIYMRVVPDGTEQTGKYLLYSALDPNNRLRISSLATSVILYTYSAGVLTSNSYIYSTQTDEPFEIIALKTDLGMSMLGRYYDGAAWTPWAVSANETDQAKVACPLDDSYYVGSLEGGAQFTANYPRTAIIAMPPKATLAEYQTWIEGELTLRGLI